MPYSRSTVVHPAQAARSTPLLRLSVWSEPYSVGRFRPLTPERQAELRRLSEEKLRLAASAELPMPQRRLPFRPKHQASGSRTYMIGAEGSSLVKIGWAKAPEDRVMALQIGSPLPLALLWSDEGPYERPLHRRFKDYRVRGEWFDLTPLGDPVEVVMAAIEEIKASEES